MSEAGVSIGFASSGQTRRPSRLLSALCFGYVFSSIAISGIPVWSRATAVLALALCVVSAVYAFTGRLHIRQWIWAPLSFATVCLVWSILTIETSQVALYGVLAAWSGGAIVAAATPQCVRPQTILAAATLGSLANAVAVAIGFDAYMLYSADLGRVAEETLLLRASGLVGNANAMAKYSVLPVFLLALFHESSRRWMWATAVPCALYAILTSGSRQGLYLGLCLLVYLAFLHQSSFSKKLLMSMGATLLVGLGALSLAQYTDLGLGYLQDIEVFRRIEAFLFGHDYSYLQRVRLVEDGFGAFLQRPFLGHGLDQFRVYVGNGYYAHNTFIELAVDGGVLMLITYYRIHLSAVFLAIRKGGLFRHKQSFAIWFFVATMLGLDFGSVSYNDKFLVLCLLLLFVCARTPGFEAGRKRPVDGCYA